jgi:hypothetical protein
LYTSASPELKGHFDFIVSFSSKRAGELEKNKHGDDMRRDEMVGLIDGWMDGLRMTNAYLWEGVMEFDIHSYYYFSSYCWGDGWMGRFGGWKSHFGPCFVCGLGARRERRERVEERKEKEGMGSHDI